MQGRESTVVYQWDGSYFAFVGKVDATIASPSDLAVFITSGTTFMAMSGFNAQGSAMYSIRDAVVWHGAVSYTDAFAPTARFFVRSINGSTLSSYNYSVLTVTLRPDREIPKDTVIALGGLLTAAGEPLSESPSTANLTFAGADAATFGSTGVWDRQTGVVLSTLAGALRANITAVFSFSLLTLKTMTPGAVPHISASGKITLPRANMNGRVLTVSEIPAASFADAVVSETSNVRGGQYNQIKVKLRPNTLVPAGTVVTVSGLTGTRTPSGVLEMTGKDAVRFASTTATKYTYWGTWNQTAGSLAVVSNSSIEAYEQVEVAFTVSNGLAARPAASPTVTTSGALTIKEQAMTCLINEAKKPGETCPVLSFSASPAWGTYVIDDSHTRVYALNTLTVTLRPNVPLVENDEITISDLRGTPSLDGYVVCVCVCVCVCSLFSSLCVCMCVVCMFV
jgi:hypothetical protein